MADENHGLPLKVFDLSDIANGNVVSLMFPSKDTAIAIPHNPLVSCDYAYVSYYYDGLQVYNIKNPSKPKLEAYYPTSTLPNNLSYKGSWGNYPYLPSGNIVVADMQNGLFVVEGVEKPCNAVYSCNPVGTSDGILNGSVKLYPNPASHIVNIETDLNLNFQECQIFDARGVFIESSKIENHSNSLQIKLDDLPIGYYWLKLITSDHRQVVTSLSKIHH